MNALFLKLLMINDSNLRFIDAKSVNRKASYEKNSMAACVSETLPTVGHRPRFKMHGFSHC